ncbi:hypothetical protein A1D25_06855 [Ursidibacter arcticus]|nr:hypothetical protein A1D25_06855 [Ursidibacter arcticus]
MKIKKTVLTTLITGLFAISQNVWADNPPTTKPANAPMPVKTELVRYPTPTHLDFTKQQGQTKQHFTDFSKQHSTIANATKATDDKVKLMNAMSHQSPTQYYRIRVGENDRDTSLAISALLALKLQNEGKQVDYAMPWGIPHSGDYDLDELFDWIKKISM